MHHVILGKFNFHQGHNKQKCTLLKDKSFLHLVFIVYEYNKNTINLVQHHMVIERKTNSTFLCNFTAMLNKFQDMLETRA